MKSRLGALLVLASSALHAQTGGLVGSIVDKTNAATLGYAIVAVDINDRSIFATDSGQFSFRELKPGTHTLSVRRLGYLPRDIPFLIQVGVVDTMRVELERVAVTLGRVDVKAWPPCKEPGAPGIASDSALARIVNQVTLNAEQFRYIIAEYPYTYVATVTRSSRDRKTGKLIGGYGVASVASKNPRGYVPGEVIVQRRDGWFFEIPTLSEVADPKFLALHCWHYAGTSEIDDEPMFEVDVVAADSIKGVDVNGSFFINRNSFQIRRSILHLSKRHPKFMEMEDLEVTTDFFEVMNSISVISHVSSVQTVDPTAKGKWSHMYEEHVTRDFKWVNRRPGDVQKP